jgi:hypothetical protein
VHRTAGQSETTVQEARRAQVGPSQKTLVNRGGLASVTVVAVTVISVAVIPVPFPLPLWLPLFPLLELLARMRPVPSPSRESLINRAR